MSNLDIYTNYKTVLSVNALIFSEGKLLLLRRAADKKVDPNMYGGIGGKLEPHEDFYSALLREIEEETGITKLKSVKLYSVTQHPYPPTDSEWVNLYFIVTIEKQIKVPNSEDGEFFWIDPKKLKNLPMPEDIKEYLKILVSNPDTMILGYFDHDSNGKTTEVKINLV